MLPDTNLKSEDCHSLHSGNWDSYLNVFLAEVSSIFAWTWTSPCFNWDGQEDVYLVNIGSAELLLPGCLRLSFLWERLGFWIIIDSIKCAKGKFIDYYFITFTHSLQHSYLNRSKSLACQSASIVRVLASAWGSELVFYPRKFRWFYLDSPDFATFYICETSI